MVWGLELESDGLALFGTVLGAGLVSAFAAQLLTPLPTPGCFAALAPQYPWVSFPPSLVVFPSVGSRGKQRVGGDHSSCEGLTPGRALLMALYTAHREFIPGEELGPWKSGVLGNTLQGGAGDLECFWCFPRE